tara:strand:- start:2048 stop:2311 length:264 start_codon:yes stop_codon:yes gene_type:complete
MTVLDYGSDSKVFVKYKIIGSGTKCKYIFILFSELGSRFLRENRVFLSCRAERVNGMKRQKWGLGSRPFLMKLFFWKVVFTEWKEMC